MDECRHGVMFLRSHSSITAKRYIFLKALNGAGALVRSVLAFLENRNGGLLCI